MKTVPVSSSKESVKLMLCFTYKHTYLFNVFFNTANILAFAKEIKLTATPPLFWHESEHIMML